MEKSSGILTVAKLVSVIVAIGVVSYLVVTAQRRADNTSAVRRVITPPEDGGRAHTDSKPGNDASSDDEAELELRPAFVPSSKSGIIRRPLSAEDEAFDDEAVFIESSKVGIIYRSRKSLNKDASVPPSIAGSDAGTK